MRLAERSSSARWARALSRPNARAVSDTFPLSGVEAMTRARLGLLAMLFFVPGLAFAQTNVTGDWDVTINSPQGANTVLVTFKQDGEKVTGIFKSPQGELPFEGGSLTG